MLLLDLPTEILVLIFEELGGMKLRSNDGAARLTVSRKWYEAAYAVYLSGVSLSNVNLGASGLNNAHLPPVGSQGRRLMHRNTRTLRLRLQGH